MSSPKKSKRPNYDEKDGHYFRMAKRSQEQKALRNQDRAIRHLRNQNVDDLIYIDDILDDSPDHF